MPKCSTNKGATSQKNITIEALQEQLAFMLAAFDRLPHPVFVKDSELRFVFINKAYEDFFNVKAEQFLFKTVLDAEYLPLKEREAFHIEDGKMLEGGVPKQYEWTFSTSNGNTTQTMYWCSGFSVGGQRGIIGTIVDISTQHNIQELLQDHLVSLIKNKRKVEALSHTDELTQLPNRRMFNQRFQQLENKFIVERQLFSMLLIDLDDFKRINDVYGHGVGDQVLQNFAKLMRNICRADDVPARIGGEEFAILLPERGKEIAKGVAARLLRAARDPKNAVPACGPVTCSIGICEYNKEENEQAFYERTDKALYHVKQNGKNNYYVAPDEE